MTRAAYAIASILGMLGCATAATAATLYSPVLNGATGYSLACRATNASATEREIRVELLTAGGLAITGNTAVVQPGGFVTASVGGNFTGSCRVTVEGGRTSVRAVLALERDVNVSDAVTELTVPVD